MVKQVELVIDLHDESGGSMSSKIVRSLRDSIDTKKLKSGDVLPPSRRLAKDLGVSRGTIVVAYEQLIAEGYLEARQGSGTVVNPSLSLFQPDEPKKTVKQPTENDVEPRPLRDERDPTQSLGDLTRRPAWKQAWRTAAVSPQLEYELPAQGSAWLQKEIAEHLRVMRATLRDAEDILITGGAREGLGLLLTALGTTRGRNLIIGVEEGGPSTLSAVASQHGAQIVLLPVDKQGLLVRALPNAFLDAVIVTPSYQHPEGAALPLERRHELIAWAKYNGTLIIEDDFDSELRFLRSPLPTLAALDDPEDGVVATLGSFSATLSISLAAGFLVIPGIMKRHIIHVRQRLGCPVAPILQIALALLLESGELRKHTAKLRRNRVFSGIVRQ